MTQIWNRERSYDEGERVRHEGVLYEAKMDLIRGLRPDDPRNKSFWRRCPTITPASAPTRQPHVRAGGYMKKVM